MANSVDYFGAVCWSGYINNHDRIRLYTFIKNASGTVRMERVMDQGYNTDDFTKTLIDS